MRRAESPRTNLTNFVHRALGKKFSAVSTTPGESTPLLQSRLRLAVRWLSFALPVLAGVSRSAWALGAARTRNLVYVASCCVLLAPCGGCTAFYLERADKEGFALRDEKLFEVEEFRANELLEPDEISGDREPATPPVAVPDVLGLDHAIDIATEYNRGYISQREGLYLQALGLGVTRRDFLRPIFGGSLAYSATDGAGPNYDDNAALDLNVSQFLPTGGTLTVSGGASLSQFADRGGDQASSLNGTVRITQPLLQGAGYTIAFETLTQAERSLLYAARSFEEFRQRFAIDVIQQYYALVSQKQQLVNTRKNIDDQRFAEEQAKALYDLGRGTQLDVFRAEQSLLSARASLLDEEQAYELALDRFKIDLGLPTDVEFDIADEEFPQLIPVDLDLQSAVRAALNNRLDLATARDQLADAERAVNVARNALLPSMDLSASYTTASAVEQTFRDVFVDSESVALGVTLELPLDRKRERNALRSALIELDQTRRDLQQTEDEVILEVRDALRQLQRQREQINIEAKNIESLRRSVEKARLENRAGLATNRDIVEAQDSLTDAENSQLDRMVAYEVTRLNLLRQLGILFVDPEGRIVP